MSEPGAKSTFRSSQSAVPPRNLQLEAPATKSALRSSQSALRATKSAVRSSQRAVPATKFADEPHVQKSRLTALVTKSERLKDHHMSKVLRLPQDLHFEVKPLRSLAPVTKSRLWTTKARSFPCACPKSDRMRGAPQHPLQPPRFCERAQSKCTSRI